MSWWKPKPAPEEEALTRAAMRVRMQLQSLGSASPNEIDRAWARIIADSLEISGWKLVHEERGSFGSNAGKSA